MARTRGDGLPAKGAAVGRASSCMSQWKKARAPGLASWNGDISEVTPEMSVCRHLSTAEHLRGKVSISTSDALTGGTYLDVAGNMKLERGETDIQSDAKEHNGDWPRQRARAHGQEPPRDWPSLARLLFYFWKNKLPLTLVFLTVCGASGIAFRAKEKTYRSIAIVSSIAVEAPNPVKESGGSDVARVDVSSFFFNQLKASLFSAELVKQAAVDTGIFGRDAGTDSIRTQFSRVIWTLGGGDMSTDAEDIERTLIDKIRFEKMSFDQLDKTKTDQAVGGLFRIAFLDKNPQAAQRFLTRVLELHREKLRASENEQNERLANFYDEQMKFFATEAARSDAGIDFASNRERLQKISRLRAELDAKLAQETQLRTSEEYKLGQIREQLSAAEARYSAQHPEVKTLRAAAAEAARASGGGLSVVRSQISKLNEEIDAEFKSLIQDSDATVEGAGVSGEGHTQFYTKKQAERRSLSKVFERMQERYFQSLVQARMADLTSKDHFQIIEAPSTPLRPDAPRLVPWILVTLIAASGCGILVSLLSELLRRRARDAWLLERRAGVRIWAEQRMDASYLLESDAFAETTSSHGESFRKHLSSIMSGFRSQRRSGGFLGFGNRQRLAKEEASESLGELLARILTHRSDDSGLLQCGIAPLTRKVTSAPVAYNLALLASRRARLKTAIVSFDHESSLMELLSGSVALPAADARGFQRVPYGDFLVTRAAAWGSTESLLEALRFQSFDCVIWDLPAADELAWHAARLPEMPLVGVVEYDSNTYSEIAEGARWLRLLGSTRGGATGLYATQCHGPRFLRLEETRSYSKVS
jgi:hypothetical protein